MCNCSKGTLTNGSNRSIGWGCTAGDAGTFLPLRFWNQTVSLKTNHKSVAHKKALRKPIICCRNYSIAVQLSQIQFKSHQSDVQLEETRNFRDNSITLKAYQVFVECISQIVCAFRETKSCEKPEKRHNFCDDKILLEKKFQSLQSHFTPTPYLPL